MTHRDRAGDAAGHRAGRREAAGDAGYRQGFPTPAPICPLPVRLPDRNGGFPRLSDGVEGISMIEISIADDFAAAGIDVTLACAQARVARRCRASQALRDAVRKPWESTVPVARANRQRANRCGRRKALTMSRTARGFPATRPMARRIARAISMSHY